MASKTTGLNKIVHAEKKAAQIITEARKRKTKRLRDAKEEAAKLVTNLNKEREQMFIEFQAKYSESRNEVTKFITEETEQKLEMMEKEYNERKDQVIEQLLNIVINDINPKLHQNLRIRDEADS